MPELVIGPPPRGDDYFGQEDLIEKIWSHLEKSNVLLVAPSPLRVVLDKRCIIGEVQYVSYVESFSTAPDTA